MRTKKSATGLGAAGTGGAVTALIRVRLLDPAGGLSSLDRAAVAGRVAARRRSFRHHVSDGTTHVAPHACGFLTAAKAEGESEGERKRADEPDEEDVDERRGIADLRRRGDDPEAKRRAVREHADGLRVRHRRLQR